MVKGTDSYRLWRKCRKYNKKIIWLKSTIQTGMDIKGECNNIKRQTHKKPANRMIHLEGTPAAARNGVEGY